MNDYYIKIKQNQSEIEFSTSDRVEFNERLSELMKLAGVLDKVPELKEQMPQKTPVVEEKSDFEKVLEKSMEHPVEQVSSNFKTDNGFKSLFESVNLDNPVDKKITELYLGNNSKTVTVQFKNTYLPELKAGEFFEDGKHELYFYNYADAQSYAAGEELKAFVNK